MLEELGDGIKWGVGWLFGKGDGGKGTWVTPYVNVRDLNETGIDDWADSECAPSRRSIEAGIKISF